MLTLDQPLNLFISQGVILVSAWAEHDHCASYLEPFSRDISKVPCNDL